MSNPTPEIKQIKNYQFKPKGKETLSKQINIKITPALNAKLKQKKNWSQFVRDVLEKALDEEYVTKQNAQ